MRKDRPVRPRPASSLLKSVISNVNKTSGDENLSVSSTLRLRRKNASDNRTISRTWREILLGKSEMRLVKPARSTLNARKRTSDTPMSFNRRIKRQIPRLRRLTREPLMNRDKRIRKNVERPERRSVDRKNDAESTKSSNSKMLREVSRTERRMMMSLRIYLKILVSIARLRNWLTD